MKYLLKRIFGKKGLTKDEKLVNVFVRLIKDKYVIEERIGADGKYTEYSVKGRWSGFVFYYEKKDQLLYYIWGFGKELYEWIPDDRLLQNNSELIGKIFEKLYESKVTTVRGYESIN